MMPGSSHSQPPFGWALTIGGGIVAQVAPTTNVGAAGLIASLSGLLLAGFQYYKVWMESRQRDERIEEQNAQIVRLKQELVDAADKRHKMRGDFNAKLLALQAEREEASHRVARLEGQLGLSNETHAKAINAISGDLQAVAGKMHPPMDVHATVVGPIDSSDELEAFPGTA